MALLFFGLQVQAQISVNNKTICKGNLASFKYRVPSGVSISKYQWSFGDGFTSQNVSPNHLYKSSGTFNVTLTATKSGGGTINGSITVKVVDLPKANFVLSPNSDSCSNTNNICFKDLSLPAKPGQNIVSRLTIWGDGAFDKNTQLGSSPLSCHHYRAVDKYPISIEITDKYGCKDFVSKSIEIIPGIEAAMQSEVSFPKCGEAQLCVSNKSIQANGIGASYDWKFNSINSNKTHISSPYCTKTNSAEHFNILLIAKSKNGCRDTARKELDLVADTSKRNLHSNFTGICYGDHSKIRFWVDSLPNDTVTWHLNDSLLSGHYGSISLFTHGDELFPGTYTIKCRIKRGNCITSLQKNITVKGPVAKMEIFNGNQCGTHRKVFFVGDETERFTPHYQYRWELKDHKGEVCNADRANDINKYKNCNTSTDWWHKHTYTDLINGYGVKLFVKDTLLGCADSTYGVVNMDACGNCNGPCDHKTICQNNWLFHEDRVPGDPVKVSFDSGATWVKYPVFLDSSYLGTYHLGYIFKHQFPSYAEDFGDDSIKIIRDTNRFSDTILCENNLTVLPNRRNGFSLSTGSACNPLEIVARLDKTEFKAGDSIVFEWADSLELIITDTVDFSLDSVVLKVRATGYSGNVSARFISKSACEYFYEDTITAGFLAKLKLKGPLCTNNQICIDAMIHDISSQSLWSMQNGLGKVKWELDSTILEDTAFTICPGYLSKGLHSVAMMLEGTKGCRDTLRKSFLVQEIKANVTSDSRNFYCNQLRQFFDSSEIAFRDSGDFIRKYLWDFGTGKYTTLERDPFRSFVGVSDDIQVSHIVESASGCRDTIDFTLGIIGSQPKFRIKDTIGCAPFEVEFINESRNASQYIWEFGDPSNFTLNTFDSGDVKFNYTQPGRFFVNLVGIDTVLQSIHWKCILLPHQFSFQWKENMGERTALVQKRE